MRANQTGRLLVVFVGLVVAAGASGCSSDPCDGVSGTCISVRVEGSVSGVDQLRVSLDGVAAPMPTPTPPKAISLPVKLAIGLSATTASPAKLTIAALTTAGVVAEQEQPVPFTPGQHVKVTFHLTAVSALDGGAPGADLSGGDLAGSDGGVFVPTPGAVSIYPSVVTFPDTLRRSSSTATLTIYNRTGVDVSGMGGTSTGAQMDFNPTTVAPSTCMLTQSGLTIPANVDCVLTIQFTPTASGVRTQMLSLTFNSTMMINPTFTGKGVATWVAENIGDLVNSSEAITSVWASGPTDVYATSNKMNESIWHSPGDGTWTPVTPNGAATTVAFATVTGNSAQQVWVGGGQTILMYNGNSWVSETPPAGETIKQLWANGTSPVIGATSHLVILRDSSANWSTVYTLPATYSSTNAVANATSNAGNFVVTGTPGFVAYGNNNGSDTTVLTTNTTAPLNGAWEAPNGNLYIVGNSASEGNAPPAILNCNFTTFTCAAETTTANRSLNGISGRLVSGTTLDMYAIGVLGTEVLHSDGSGTWAEVPVPQHGGMNAVFVLPSGEVYVVGQAGQINHYLN